MSEQILDAIVGAGRPIFDQLAPGLVKESVESSDTHSLLFAAEYTFRFRTQEDMVKLFLAAEQSSPEEGRAPEESLEPPFHLTTGEAETLPKFSTRDIRVLERLLGDGYFSCSRRRSGNVRQGCG